MKLQFYKKGISNKTIRRIVFLCIIFCVSLVFFEIITNFKQEAVISKMTSPTIPTINVHISDSATTTLHGYVTEMDPCYMRDAVIPVYDDRTLRFSMDCDTFDLETLSYEIRSLDTQRKIASNDINFKQKSDKVSAKITAENLIEPGEEYLLIIKASSDNKNYLYYTRIMQTKDCHEKEIIDFAMNFHDTALSDNPDSLSTYVEPAPYEDSQSLHHVNINSSLDLINYGKFEGKQSSPTYVTLTDITPSYISLTLAYYMESGDYRKPTFYNCQENFRIRYTADRFYLLDYDRTMEQQLDKNSIIFNENMVNVGIRDEDVQYLSNETGTIVAFVQSGSLFEYNETERSLKQIYSFIKDDPTDIRATYNQHQILILNIDESGTMDYVVYGYMNAGSHEGESGINLYHYDASTDISTEQVFISSKNSYQILNANFSDLIYETSDNHFYIMINGTLLHMQLDHLKTEELLTGLDASQYAVSGSGRYVAWTDQPVLADTIHILDLETQKSFDITAKNGQLVRPLAFIEDDFVYGTLHKKNITKDGAGTDIYPMHRLTISNISNNTEHPLINYQKTGIYVSDVSVDSYTLNLSRIRITKEGNILEAKKDTIKNSSGEQNKAVPITKTIDKKKQEVIILNMTPLEKKEKLGKVSIDNSKLSLASETRNVNVSTLTSTTQYFVYQGNSVILATDDLYEAISTASENNGVVLNNVPSYIWKCSGKSFQSDLSGIVVGSSDNEANSAAQALSAMLVYAGENVQVHTLLETGETPMSILSRTLKDYTILDLTGLNLKDILYYVNNGTPVYAKTGEDSAILIIGYDANTISIFDPNTSSTSHISYEEAEAMFKPLGNVFVSYIK